MSSVNLHLKQLLLIAPLALLLLITACSHTPAQPASYLKWPKEDLQTQFIQFAFLNHAFLNHAFPNSTAKQQDGSIKRLHVYIEGDGTPFIFRMNIAENPTPRHPLTFDLMQQDSTPSINLSRPCYFVQDLKSTRDTECSSVDWTSARASKKIVDNMIAALRLFLQKHPAEQVTLIGYSGGGTIAILMAQQMPEVDQLVTIAGNLNLEAWTKFHDYTPLKNSLDPAKIIHQAIPRKQIHLSGAKDDNIPAQLGQVFLKKIGQSYWMFADSDHGCCWLQHWPQVLQAMNEQIKPSP